MKKKLYTSVIFVFLISIINAQTIRLNDEWLFQRLNSNMTKGTIGNQGTDWESQYSVTHTSVSAQLEIPRDTLSAEFALLKKSNWERVTLPHTPKVEDLVVLYQWQGICYYKKELKIQPDWKNKKIGLEFEGAMHLADVWVNGVHIMQHAGGYTPFVADLTPFVKAEKTIEILVRLDNRDNPLIPPGKPLNKLDFCYYGGLYRDVNLIVKPETYISHPIQAEKTAGGGIFVTYPEVSDQKAIVQVKTHVINESPKNKNLTVRQRLIQLDGLYGKKTKQTEILKKEDKVAINAGENLEKIQELIVRNPRLWALDTPHLYLLETEISDGNKIIDKQSTRIGIRQIEFSKAKGFVINGKPTRLVGSNRHMEYPYAGNALSDNAQYRDIYQIKESGFNIVRLGHYPQDPSVLDACDELGLLAIEPIPGWQFFNKDSLFINLTFRDIRDMIRRDRNHPSVVIWETTLNESWPPDSWKDAAVKVAHEEYPGNQCYTSGDGYGYDGFDVVYNDWKEGFLRPNPGTKAGFIREYYDYEFGGHYSTTRISRGDGEKALLQNAWNAQWSHNRYRKQYPSTSGDAVWSMYDYNRGCCDNICYSGVADLFRLPKFSLHFFKSQYPVGTPLPSGEMKPYLFIANYWTQRNENNDTVFVYGNVDEVELRINGKTIDRKKADKGADTEYVTHGDEGNCLQLTQAPFTFTGIAWMPGSLEAIGYIGGKQITSDKRLTPSVPVKLQIDYFESGCKAGKDDLLIVYVHVLDKNGTLCVENNQETIRLSVNKGNEVVGPATMKTEAGIASFLVRTGNVKSLSIEAESSIGKEMKQLQLNL